MEKNAFKIAESMAKMQPLLQGDTERQGMKWGCREGEVGRTFPLERKKKEEKKKKERKKIPQTSPTPQSFVSIWKAVSFYKDLKCCKNVIILSDKGCWREGNQMDSGF